MADGQAGPRATLVGRIATLSVAFAIHVLTVVMALTVLALTVLGVLAWRLSEGPIDIAWLARRFEANSNAQDNVARLSIESAALAWEGFTNVDRPIDIRVRGLRATDASGNVVAAIPEGSVSLSLPWLLVGRFRPRAVDVDGADLRFVRGADGTIKLDLGGVADPPTGPPAAPTGETPFNRLLAEFVRPAQDDQAADGARARDSLYSQLRRVRIRDAKLTVIDRELGAVWHAPAADLDLRRGEAGGVQGHGSIALGSDRTLARLTLDATLGTEGGTRIVMRLAPLNPAALSRPSGALAQMVGPAMAPMMAPLAPFDLPVGLDATIDLAADLSPLRARATARLGAGSIALADTPVHIDHAEIAVDLARAGAPTDRLGLGAARAELQATATFVPQGRPDRVSTELRATAESTRSGTHVEASLAPVDPSSLAGVVPMLAPGSNLAAPVSFDASAQLAPDFSFVSAHAQGRVGAGRVTIKASTIQVDGADVTVDAMPDRLTVHPLRIVLTPPPGRPDARPPVMTVSVDAHRAEGRLRAEITADLDQAQFSDLGRYWPDGTDKGARAWVVHNVTSGQAHDAHFVLGLEGPLDNPDDIDLVSASGGVTAEDVTIHWLRPVPPIEHVRARLRFSGPDVIEVDAVGGQQSGARGAPLRLGATHVKLTGITAHDQFADIDSELGGPLPAAISLLHHPKIGILDRRPIPMNAPAGTLAGHLTVHLPLKADLDLDSLGIHARMKATSVHLGAIAAGRDLDRGAFDLDVGNDGLTLRGGADLARIPSRLSVDMDFRSGGPGQIVQRVTASGRANESELATAGLDLRGSMTGTAALSVDYSQRRDGRAEARLHADLTDAGLRIPLGWAKAKGQAAHADARAVLRNDRIVGVDLLSASGPGLRIDSRAELVGGEPVRLYLDRVLIGETSARGEIGFSRKPGDPIRLRLNGTTLDLSSQLRRAGAPTDTGAAARNGVADRAGTPFVVDARFEHVLLARGRNLGPVSLHAESNGSRVRVITATSSGVDGAKVTLVPDGNGRTIDATSADAGALLGALDVTDNVLGGLLRVHAHLDDSRPGSPISGSVELDDFRVRGAPWVGKLMQAVTIYGVVDALRGPGLVFERLVAPFSLDGDVLTLTDARAFSLSLGMTAKGRIDLARQTLSIEGTIVPAYAVNALLGHMPVMGRLFSPEPGGGVFAATFGLNGALDNPSVGINPLAALTPGFLRGIFGIFD